MQETTTTPRDASGGKLGAVPGKRRGADDSQRVYPSSMTFVRTLTN
ncbi:MAG: hypothetical protein P4L90_03640 [Rhodopila sp.]|nr:hypothetical protein [Rhodopila sp.]